VLIIHLDSHLDHNVGEATLAWLLERFRDQSGFLAETLTLADYLPALANGLHGPACGDPPVPDHECTWVIRGKRTWPSRVCHRPSRSTRIVTVIAGPHDDLDCVLYTVYGGPLALQEPGDPTCKDRAASSAFWAVHALSID
jgi:hypothetical protein